MRDVIEECIRSAVTVGMLVYIWKLKWRTHHPRTPEDLIETEAEIANVQFRRRWLWSPKEEARALIYAKFTRENGKPYAAQLATCPIRKQLDMYAPELMQKGTRVQIRYERKHPDVFYFTDPRYTAPEVSGEPRKVRISYFTLAVFTVFFLVLEAVLWYATLCME
ncbi:MAG: hypothetical protein IJ060_03920 [Oscillospiraceae bacterium]|nr:hypothetical protein [Oscillospiraceae bacterium]